MSLLRRLADIARSHLQEPAPGWAPSQGPAPGGTAGGDPEPDPPASRDPRLAGYYANLELPYGAPLTEVRSAWRRLMKQYHPDLHSRDPAKRQVADELTARLTEAYRQLEAALGDTG